MASSSKCQFALGRARKGGVCCVCDSASVFAFAALAGPQAVAAGSLPGSLNFVAQCCR